MSGANLSSIMKYGVALGFAGLALVAAPLPAFADDAPAGSNLQAGGLKPPEAVQTDTTPTGPAQTEAQLDRADKEDSGRGLEFVALNAEVGPEVLGLRTLKDKGLVDGTLIDSTGTGLMVGAGLGVRMLAYTLGARFRFGNFSDWQMWTLGAEGGFHIPLGNLEPYASLGVGYASLGAFDKAKSGLSPNNAHGFYVRPAVGVDYYLSNTFSIGGNLSGDVLFLSRSGAGAVPLPSDADPGLFAANALYAKDGSSIGLGGTLSLVLGLHF